MGHSTQRQCVQEGTHLGLQKLLQGACIRHMIQQVLQVQLHPRTCGSKTSALGQIAEQIRTVSHCWMMLIGGIEVC